MSDPVPDAFYRDAEPTARLQAMYLLRLRRLITWAEAFDVMNDLGLQILERAIDATYRDCTWAGCADAALRVRAVGRRRRFGTRRGRATKGEYEDA